MIAKISPILIAICIIVLIKSTHQYRTAIAVKQGVTDFSTDPMAAGVSTFRELVRKSKMFIDNTLFIEEALSLINYPWLLIGPKKWGKTINLDMLKYFLQITHFENGTHDEDRNSSESFRLFVNGEIVLDDGTVQKLEKPLLISECEDVMFLRCASIPVIHMDFKNVTGSNYTEVERNFREAIRTAFLEHKYMVNVLTGAELKRFKDIIKKKTYKWEYDWLIKFLSDMLYTHFHRRVVILIDNYDSPVTNTFKVPNFPKDDLYKLLEMLESFNYQTFKFNSFFRSSVVTGNFELEPIVVMNVDVDFHWEDINQRGVSIDRYFGINEDDVHALLDKAQIPLQDQVHQWYGGFVSVNDTQRFYNPFSIANFLKEKKLVPYWKNPELPEIYDRFVEKKTKQFFSLFSKQRIGVFRRYEITETRYHYIKSADPDDDYEASFQTGPRDTELQTNGFFFYLYRMGYFAPCEMSCEKLINVTIPNKELAFALSDLMMSYFHRRYHLTDRKLLEEAAQKLSEFLNNEPTETTMLENALQHLYDRCFQHHQNLTYVPAILNYVALKIQRQSQFDTKVYYDKIMTADIVIVNNEKKQAIIIEVGYNDTKSAEQILQAAESHKNIFDNSPYKIDAPRFIAVEVSSDFVVKVMAKIKDKVIVSSNKHVKKHTVAHTSTQTHTATQAHSSAPVYSSTATQPSILAHTSIISVPELTSSQATQTPLSKMVAPLHTTHAPIVYKPAPPSEIATHVIPSEDVTRVLVKLKKNQNDTELKIKIDLEIEC